MLQLKRKHTQQICRISGTKPGVLFLCRHRSQSADRPGAGDLNQNLSKQTITVEVRRAITAKVGPPVDAVQLVVRFLQAGWKPPQPNHTNREKISTDEDEDKKIPITSRKLVFITSGQEATTTTFRLCSAVVARFPKTVGNSGRQLAFRFRFCF